MCAIKEVLSNHIVGTLIGARIKSRIAVNALSNTAARRGGVAGCILEINLGPQLRIRTYIRILDYRRMVGLMGRIGAADDIAAMESFFALLQNPVQDRRIWATRKELRIRIVTWIERTHYRRRREDALSQLDPIRLATIMTTPATQAAQPNQSPDGAADPWGQPLPLPTNQLP